MTSTVVPANGNSYYRSAYSNGEGDAVERQRDVGGSQCRGAASRSEPDWQAIGLHHAGGEYVRELNGCSRTYAANKAVWIPMIAKAMVSLTG